jgi:LmbE family N-acetylglucosaminyl deacetylase
MKPVVGIFAHPDDEAFGPAGALALWAKERDVYLICVTNGDAGMNESDKKDPLNDIRKNELEASAKVLGVKKVFFLGYKDGELSNNLYHEIADKIGAILETLQPEKLITFEPRGLSGHIDHIAVSMITSFIFEKSSFVHELWQYCLDEEQRSAFGDYYIYFPQGYKKEEITDSVDVSGIWKTKVAAMHQHESQKKDMEKAMSQVENLPKKEHFIVRKKN